MKLFIIILMTLVSLVGCKTTITIDEYGVIKYEGPRKVSIATEDVVIVTSEMLLDQDTLRVLVPAVAEVVDKDK